MFPFHLILVRDNRGLTLLELVLVVALMGLILAALLPFYLVSLTGFARGTGRIDLQQNARIVLHEITRELCYATDLYDKNRSGQKVALQMPFSFDEDEEGASRLFLTGTDGEEREIRFNEEKGSVTLRKGSRPDNELGYGLQKTEFFWHSPPGMLPQGDDPMPRMVLVCLEVGKAEERGESGSSPYLLQNVVYLRNMKR